MPPPPLHDRGDVLAYCVGELTRAVADPEHPWHWPALATTRPGVRVVVLRGFHRRDRPTVRFFTDLRSAKTEELSAAGGACELLFYHGRHRTQLRLSGTAVPLDDVASRRALWEAQSPRARRHYATDLAPGTILPEADHGRPPGLAESGGERHLEGAFPHFGVYDVAVARVDFLLLGHDGQLRCRWGGVWEEGELAWVTP